jgi:hypothetical protein
VGELSAFFEPAGAHPDQTLLVVQRLADRGLIEALDPTIEVLSLGSRVAITESGTAHIDLVRTSDVYVEQMAMATGINSRRTFESIKDDKIKATSASFSSLLRTFVQYITDIDSQRLKLPTTKEYAAARDGRDMVRALSSTALATRRPSFPEPMQSAPSPGIGTPFKRG